MIYEYALDPKMVASWGGLHKYRFFKHEFGLDQGRLVSRYPKSWAKMVYDSYAGTSTADKKRLVEILVLLKKTIVKRKDCVWDENKNSWLENALTEHARYSFRAILTRNNPENLPQITCEDDIGVSQCQSWDAPHGITVNRKAQEMAAAIEMMLARCRWVKFIDPYFSKCKLGHKKSLSAFMGILAAARPVGSLEEVEIHTSGNGATTDFLKEFFEGITPVGLTVTLFQWQERPNGQRLHNRYILTDLGGVSFLHGLDTGADGETDDINRLDQNQYELRCKQYDRAAPAFDQAANPIVINGTLEA